MKWLTSLCQVMAVSQRSPCNNKRAATVHTYAHSRSLILFFVLLCLSFSLCLSLYRFLAIKCLIFLLAEFFLYLQFSCLFCSCLVSFYSSLFVIYLFTYVSVTFLPINLLTFKQTFHFLLFISILPLPPFHMFSNNKIHIVFLFSKQTILLTPSIPAQSAFNQHCPRSICLFNIWDLAFGDSSVIYLIAIWLSLVAFLAPLSFHFFLCVLSQFISIRHTPQLGFLSIFLPIPSHLWRMSFGAASDSYNQIYLPHPSIRNVFDLPIFL